RIHGCDRARAHGEHVAQDAADARCRALIGLDIRRVVVALHLEDNPLALTDIDHPGIFAWALNNLWSVSWKRAQPLFRAIIRAMLVPHGREDAEFGESRLPADQVENTLIFVRLQPMRGHQLVSDGDRVRDAHYAS